VHLHVSVLYDILGQLLCTLAYIFLHLIPRASVFVILALLILGKDIPHHHTVTAEQPCIP